MTITEELAKDQRVTAPKGECSMCTWIEAQPDASEWDDALAQPSKVYSAASIHRLAQKRGCTLGVTSLQNHRYAGHRR